MLSKFFKQAARPAQVTRVAQRTFRASAPVAQKPSIGDSVTILSQKVSNISQVVSAPSS